jgi:hypothetical protein
LRAENARFGAPAPSFELSAVPRHGVSGEASFPRKLLAQKRELIAGFVNLVSGTMRIESVTTFQGITYLAPSGKDSFHHHGKKARHPRHKARRACVHRVQGMTESAGMDVTARHRQSQ